jgi:hypothetical protein
MYTLLNYREERRGLVNIIRYKIKIRRGLNLKIANLHFAIFLNWIRNQQVDIYNKS